MTHNLLIIEGENYQCWLNFGGFYESLHGWILEAHVKNLETDCEEDLDKESTDWDLKVNWDLAYRSYSKSLVGWINEEVGINLIAIDLYSPKSYNFETDVISVIFCMKDYHKVKQYLEENWADSLEKSALKKGKINNQKDLCETTVDNLLEYKCTSRSGYIALKNFDDIKDEKSYRMEAMLELLVDYFDCREEWNFSKILDNVVY